MDNIEKYFKYKLIEIINKEDTIKINVEIYSNGLNNEPHNVEAEINKNTNIMEITKNGIKKIVELSKEYVSEISFQSNEQSKKLLLAVLTGIMISGIVPANLSAINTTNLNYKTPINIQEKKIDITQTQQIITKSGQLINVEYNKQVKNEIIDEYKKEIEQVNKQVKEDLKVKFKEILKDAAFYDVKQVDESFDQLFEQIVINLNFGTSTFEASAGMARDAEGDLYPSIDLGMAFGHPTEMEVVIKSDKENFKKIIYNLLVHEYTHEIGLIFQSSDGTGKVMSEKEAILMQKMLGKQLTEGTIKSIITSRELTKERFDYFIEKKESKLEKIIKYIEKTPSNFPYLKEESIKKIDQIFKKTISIMKESKKDFREGAYEIMGSRKSEAINGYFSATVKENGMTLEEQILESVDDLSFLESRGDKAVFYHKTTTTVQEQSMLNSVSTLNDDIVWETVIKVFKETNMTENQRQEIGEFLGKITNLSPQEFIDYIENVKQYKQPTTENIKAKKDKILSPKD